MNEEDINKRVFLFSSKRTTTGGCEIITWYVLVNAGMFDLQEGRKTLKELKEAHYIANDQLTVKGIAVAMEAEAEFKL